MAELIGSIVILIGAVFLFSAGLGMLRMPDAFTRIQAGTKASTLGNTLVLVGIAFYHPELEREAADHRLFRAHDQSNLLACARPRRERQFWRAGAIASRRMTGHGPNDGATA